jgi:DNA repair exonuclease SbcCD ATPase subunit|uniref:Chromosome segregation protein n=1 Tax=Siphoviridae sp. ct6bb17 TaxID=2825345 RepID=A0A8S5NZI2_9CAUD|nr:MAG TPA: chromosome segregation protein [Siphoviridae sp. ct6bb17]
MNITKIKIKNLFGIKEYDADGKSIELIGKNGVGKSSVIDAIKYALTNKSDRDYIVRSGETEGEIIIETDTGLSIDRKCRTNQADYKAIKQSGVSVNSPETLLRELFTNLQLNPVEFLQMTKQQQNSIILDMINYDWNLNTIKEWFGEIPSWINYEQNILKVLSDIQSEKGEYFKTRQDINRDIRNKKAFIEDIAKTIPVKYDVERWEKANLGEAYKTIEAVKNRNNQISKAKILIQNQENTIRGIDADREIAISALNKEIDAEAKSINDSIVDLKHQIEMLEKQGKNLTSEKEQKLKVIEAEHKEKIAQFETNLKAYEEYANAEIKDTTEMEQKVANAEEMKSHINEYRRMERLENEVDELKTRSDALTAKIEKARNLPGKILEECSIPIDGLTVVDGIPLINGLPVSNLSDGEKLNLCVDVAIQNPNGLHIILIDGIERLASDMRENLYKKCKEKGLQFIATRTTDDEDMTVIEL